MSDTQIFELATGKIVQKTMDTNTLPGRPCFLHHIARYQIPYLFPDVGVDKLCERGWPVGVRQVQ